MEEIVSGVAVEKKKLSLRVVKNGGDRDGGEGERRGSWWVVDENTRKRQQRRQRR